MKYAIVSNPRDRLSTGLANAGSVAIVSLNLARSLATRHDVMVVVSRGAGETERERFAPRLEVLRIARLGARLQKYRELAATAFEAIPPYFLAPRYHHDFYAQAARALAEWRPDVIHIQNYGQAAEIFRKHCPRARIVLHLHDTCLAQVARPVAQRILGQADLVVACSEHVARSVSAAHPWLEAPVVAINNGVDVESFKPRDEAASRAGDAVRIAYVGRLSPEKGVHILIDAFNEVITRAPQVRLELLGGASMFSYAVVKLFRRDPHWAAIFPFYGSNPLQRLLRQLHRPGKRYVDALLRRLTPEAARAVSLLGDQPHERIAAAIADADIVVLPSVCDEPFGIPAVEAMAAGVPVVAAAAGGLPDIVQHGKTGLLAARSDARSLADALLSLIGDPAQRGSMGHAGRVAAAAFTWDRAVARLLQALERAGIAAQEPSPSAEPARP